MLGEFGVIVVRSGWLGGMVVRGPGRSARGSQADFLERMNIMNILDLILARINANAVKVKTTVDSYAVIERIEKYLGKGRKIRDGDSFYTYEGTYKGNYFKIQCHLLDAFGNDKFPAEKWITVDLPFYSFQIPYRFETSPVFYANVFDDESGSVIRGHFGIPLPFLYLIAAIVMLLGALWLGGTIRSYLFVLGIGLTIIGTRHLREFFTEREGTLIFIQNIFKDVIREEHR
jgi:hypothetical protein